MQQESGGNGNDVFQASESKGLPPNTLSTAESIKQGVAYLSAMIKKAGCTSPSDILHIKLALQSELNMAAYQVPFSVFLSETATSYAPLPVSSLGLLPVS